MKLLIISGLSGSGKSIALDTLEDCGYFCIDNLPITLLENFINHVMLVDKSIYKETAIGIDSRNQGEGFQDFGQILGSIRRKGIRCEVFFIQADDAILLKRYSETRRRHPLTDTNLALQDAIRVEKEMLKTILINADLVIDTSRMHYHQLRELIKNQVVDKNAQQLSLQFQSFGFKHGIPMDVDFMFDARSLPNPYWVRELRQLTGKDQAVVEFLSKEPLVNAFFQDIAGFLEKWIPKFIAENRSYLTVAIGCTGGQHRSVFLADNLARHFQGKLMSVIVRHRELF